MYGMIIGERPMLLKNFLGRKKTKKRPNSGELGYFEKPLFLLLFFNLYNIVCNSNHYNICLDSIITSVNQTIL